MAPRGMMELRLRLGDDAMFGPWIGFGQGGTTADIARDEALDLPPLNLPLAHGLIARTRLSRLLPGFRDRPAVHEPAIADALVRLSQLQVDFPEIAAASVNPLFADASGVVAADAGLTLRPEGEAALLAIPPYPAELVGPFTARDGRVFEVRPIRPEDARPRAIRARIAARGYALPLLSSMKELPPAMLARLTQIDYGREMAFIATREGRVFGTARIIREGGGETAEFAVVVSPAAKGTGVARHLMERAMDWAKAEGITEIIGHVLADNAPMQGFMRKLGFTLSRSLEDSDILLAKKRFDSALIRAWWRHGGMFLACRWRPHPATHGGHHGPRPHPPFPVPRASVPLRCWSPSPACVAPRHGGYYGGGYGRSYAHQQPVHRGGWHPGHQRHWR
jgi:acetyltransferase